ncbi:selenocysteine lyase/cysteine desulfurase [Halohasta litchfieldiae]|jgi:selenocysteine lyase/cysteine desulfurase|uniref:Selenocysteine lyase/Cysteine desulfurase n=1 Tax=Halohasta litchfieldiae TaxID=1073996 RepID=A0A1H6WDQ9_9EURY|nr:aminotransferase class V-fold PLP-dependent enzyme [Halohasta litchfieldiae]ATW87081.1 selenocysteine lyase/cysteine desulfurase [Halohasta litchfieldiae]SEJ12237.1 Selenocysteine lyase/Cysteine desulfurase [Halohasta litchfieldiae]
MTPRELRESIPALAETTFFNTGASGPSPQPVINAATDCLRHHKAEAPAAEGMYTAAREARSESRETIAAHLGVAPDELALTESTSDAISALAAAIDWQPGDTIVRTDLEHPAGVLPWQRAARQHGASVRVLETTDGRVDIDSYTEAVADARLVCFSSLSWNYGTQLPVSQLVDIAHDADCEVLVDAVQSAGQTSVDLDAWGAEYVAGSGHKWLLGPWGSGYLYVREGCGADLHPAQVCYNSVEDPDADEYTLKSTAQQFERGTASPAPHVGMAAAVDLFEAVGMDVLEDRIEELTDRLKAAVPDGQLLSPTGFESGLVTIDVAEPESVVETLAAQEIRIRSLPEPDAVRASVHAFNTEAEVDALVAALDDCGALD